MNRNPFCLYENVEGWQEATNDIAAVIKAQVNLVNAGKKDVMDGWKEVAAVLRKYEPWGANDSASREEAHDTFWNAVS